MIEGDLDLYEKDEVHMIELEGRLDQTKGPEIKGLWPGGDFLRLSLNASIKAVKK